MIYTIYRKLKEFAFGKQYSSLHIHVNQVLTHVFESSEDSSFITVREYNKHVKYGSMEYTVTKDIFSKLLSYIIYSHVGNDYVDIYFKGSPLEYHIDKEAVFHHSQEEIVEDTLDFIRKYWGHVLV